MVDSPYQLVSFTGFLKHQAVVPSSQIWPARSPWMVWWFPLGCFHQVDLVLLLAIFWYPQNLLFPQWMIFVVLFLGVGEMDWEKTHYFGACFGFNQRSQTHPFFAGRIWREIPKFGSNNPKLKNSKVRWKNLPVEQWNMSRGLRKMIYFVNERWICT